MAEDKFEQAVIDKLKSEGWEYLTALMLDLRTDFLLPCKLIAYEHFLI